VNKIEKSTTLGEDLIYKPKIWWFPHLEWIADFMKTRMDSTPLSHRGKFAKTELNQSELFEFEEEVDDSKDQLSYTTIEYTEYNSEATDGEPSIKKQKVQQKPITAQISDEHDESGIRTIEYTLINEDTNEVQTPEKRLPEFVEYHEVESSSKSIDRYKRRSKTFGKYVSALLIEITDDKTFFELQRNITDAIHEAGLKQQALKKS